MPLALQLAGPGLGPSVTGRICRRNLLTGVIGAAILARSLLRLGLLLALVTAMAQSSFRFVSFNVARFTLNGESQFNSISAGLQTLNPNVVCLNEVVGVLEIKCTTE